jgi:hypothetical protein
VASEGPFRMLQVLLKAIKISAGMRLAGVRIQNGLCASLGSCNAQRALSSGSSATISARMQLQTSTNSLFKEDALSVDHAALMRLCPRRKKRSMQRVLIAGPVDARSKNGRTMTLGTTAIAGFATRLNYKYHVEWQLSIETSFTSFNRLDGLRAGRTLTMDGRSIRPSSGRNRLVPTAETPPMRILSVRGQASKEGNQPAPMSRSATAPRGTLRAGLPQAL